MGALTPVASSGVVTTSVPAVVAPKIGDTEAVALHSTLHLRLHGLASALVRRCHL